MRHSEQSPFNPQGFRWFSSNYVPDAILDRLPEQPMSLSDAVAEALANASPAPPNESTTCEWVIYPLLQAAGYARREIISRIADSNGQYPDYTILPDTPHTWY